MTDKPQSDDVETGNMPEQKPPKKRNRIRRFFLAIDALIDTALWKSGTAIRRIFEGYDAFLRRFRAKESGAFLPSFRPTV